MSATYSTLIIRQASILDLDTGEFLPSDLYLEHGIIKDIASKIHISAHDEINGKDLCLTPGLCDAHAHIFRNLELGYLGLDPLYYHLPFGTTCIIDQGTAGADTYTYFKYHVLNKTDALCKEVLNCSKTGIFISSLTGPGELANLDDLDEEAFLTSWQKDPETIIGVKIRLTPNVCPNEPLLALKRAKNLAKITGLPLVVHPNQAEIDDNELFAQLSDRDVFTHAFHDSPVGILEKDRTIKKAVIKARERGVIFDTAHGSNSLSFPVLCAALEQGFEPDTISTDLHNGNYNGPVYDLPTTISKFLCLGIPLHKALRKAITEPVRIWKLNNKCTKLQQGMPADIAAFRIDTNEHIFVDATGNQLCGNIRLIPQFTILRDKIYSPKATIYQ